MLKSLGDRLKSIKYCNVCVWTTIPWTFIYNWYYEILPFYCPNHDSIIHWL